MYIIHSVNKLEYENEIKTGSYGRNSIEKFGFIHCSDLDTYYLVAPNFKDDYSDRVILLIDTDKVDCDIRWEDGGGVLFPHVYGLIKFDAIANVLPHLWDDNRNWVPNLELATNGLKREG